MGSPTRAAVVILSLGLLVACSDDGGSAGGASDTDVTSDAGLDSLFDMNAPDGQDPDADTNGLACDPASADCEIPCQLLPAMYKDWVESHLSCTEDEDCAMVGGTSSCDCAAAIWKPGGDPVNVAGQDTAAAYLARFEDPACDGFRETFWICDAAPSSDLRCDEGSCTATGQNCNLPPDQAEVVDPETSSDTILVEGSLSCKDFYRQCVNACPTTADGLPEESCFEACKPYLTTTGQADLDALLLCLDGAGCNALQGQEALLCFANSCFDEYTGCFQGEDKCGDVLGCMGDCPEDDENGACAITCTQEGTPEAQQALFDILGCLTDTCCPGDYAACQTPTGEDCTKEAVGFGGDCFTLATACVMGD